MSLSAAHIDDGSNEGGSDPNGWPNDAGFDVGLECREPTELQVFGSIPEYCAGTFYRTGPGKWKIDTHDGGSVALSHWFDGFSQIHRFHLLPPSSSSSSFRVLYNSRFTSNTLMENIYRTGKIDIVTFGQIPDPCESFFKKITSFFLSTRGLTDGPPDSQNINVSLATNVPGIISFPTDRSPSDAGWPSKAAFLVNSTDANQLQLLDPETLEPIGLTSQSALHPELTGPLCATHSRVDPCTGDHFNYNLRLYPTAYRVFGTSASTGTTTILATITDAPPAYVHSLLLTPNYVVLCIWGSHYSFYGLKVIYTKNIIDALDPLDPSKPCRWYVIDRSPQNRGVMAVYTSPSFFAFHTINAYEEESPTRPGEIDIVADIVCYDDLSILKKFYCENLKSGATRTETKSESSRYWLSRHRLPKISATTPAIEPIHPAGPQNPASLIARPATLDFTIPRSSSLELPTINARFTTQKHRYIYGLTDRCLSTMFDGIGKLDCMTRTLMVWSEPGHTPSEPVFVADPEGKEEDAGTILTVVLNGHRRKSYLLALDARTMMEIGRADVLHNVPFGIHGMHAPGAFGA